MKRKTTQLIGAGTMIDEMVRRFPETVAVLESYGLQCSECALITGATVAKGAERHHIDLGTLLGDLNRAVRPPRTKR